ncbi:DUF72 domain-containing protein [Carnobacterium antarcticum]|uniref:DUF72 domain-containing protein n=1 Tax=Carnobacterium antarcticum TaxID=2126436 RepID=A0ABW4NJ79_9LACT|nr:DUF72 domain-containing protein [Carnobacterium sp. CP1]ALV22435.1 hypothetical protein NY10_1841 [Carnobacterium sp. CP1]
MITIGLTGWNDHELLITHKKRNLEDYASHFPFVELDTSFYAIPPTKNILSWIDRTPDAFQFLPKAFQAMTQHKEWLDFFPSEEAMFQHYLAAFAPMIEANKIKAFLFQFPPFFHYSEEHLTYLRKIRHWMGELPVAIEFRHASWYSGENQPLTLTFLEQQNFIHAVIDQPQTPGNSVPMIATGTNPELTVLRLHGRNYEGWLNASGPNWREKRTFYDYSQAELASFIPIIRSLEKDSKEVAVIFNNNSGGHAAANAKYLQKILGLTFDQLGPQQLGLDLFNDF